MASSTRKTRVCKDCGRRRKIDEFARAQRTHKDGTVVRYRLFRCQRCQNARTRKRRGENREAYREREAQWRKDNPERQREIERRWNHSPAGKATRKRYEKSAKGKRAQRTFKKRKREQLKKLSANIPVAVLKPFVERMLREVDEYYVGAGSKGERERRGPTHILAEQVGVRHEDIYGIIRPGGRIKQVKLDVADKLAIYGDFTLEELYERAEEWAFLAGDKWPKGYYRK